MQNNWKKFVKSYYTFPPTGFSLDLSHLSMDAAWIEAFNPRWEQAWKAMNELESGSIANPDENRQVGHYWLRSPALAPEKSLTHEISSTLDSIRTFAADIHNGTIIGADGPFRNLLLIGIGGSALGPQLVDRALKSPDTSGLETFYFDNTDPDGMDLVLSTIGASNFGKTLVVVISKSGGTKETRNGMLEAQSAWEKAGYVFHQHAVAITSDSSQLHNYATKNAWMRTFPMWDWVGGRTSVMSAVGLLPAALAGYDIQEFLKGASDADQLTRCSEWQKNPAAQIAASWYFTGNGRGEKSMVILPYKDRLDLFSKYLQQLVMESLGKEYDLQGNQVHQGISVYGNKGSTDQHAYVQQLRDGIHNFFVTFIEVLKDRQSPSIEVESGITSGDYLAGFLQGTRTALSEKGRESITLTIPEVTPYYLGFLIAIYERAVGYYAHFVRINAYHQPGVEAGKKAAGRVIDIILAQDVFLKQHPGQMFHVEQLAKELGRSGEEESVFRILRHLAANRPGYVMRENPDGVQQYQFGYLQN